MGEGYPGETMVMEMWKLDDLHIVVKVKTKERPDKTMFIGKAYFYENEKE